MFRW